MQHQMENRGLERALICSILNKTFTSPMPSNINSSMLYRLALRHRVGHQIQQAIPDIDLFNHYCKNSQRKIFMHACETIRISNVFNLHSIKHCFVKGPLLNVHLYGALNTRPCRDLDVWVPLTHYQQAMSCLEQLGYQQKTPLYPLVGFKKKYFLKHHHDTTWFHPTHKIWVELHFKLSHEGLNFFTFNQVAFQNITLLNQPITTLSDDYHLLYLMMHGAMHAWSRLRWLHDVALYLESNRCDLNHVKHLAQQRQCEHVMLQTFILLKKYFNIKNKVIDDWLQNPSRQVIKLAELAECFMHTDYEIHQGMKNIKMFYTYRIYLLHLAVRGQKTKVMLGDLFKIDKVFPYVFIPKGFGFLYYLIYPIWVVRQFFRKRCVAD